MADRMIDRRGPPLVLIPGIQGRWEWMRPAVDALAKHFRVISFSLCRRADQRLRFDPALGFDNYVAQVDACSTQADVERAVIAASRTAA